MNKGEIYFSFFWIFSALICLLLSFGKLSFTFNKPIEAGQVWVESIGNSDNPFKAVEMQTNTILAVGNGYVLYQVSFLGKPVELSCSEKLFRMNSALLVLPKVEK